MALELRVMSLWLQLSRQWLQGPMPQPCWRPLPGLLYAQVVQSYRRRRIVRVKPQVLLGVLDAAQQGLATVPM